MLLVILILILISILILIIIGDSDDKVTSVGASTTQTVGGNKLVITADYDVQGITIPILIIITNTITNTITNR